RGGEGRGRPHAGVRWASIRPQRVRCDPGQEVEREPRRREHVALAVFGLAPPEGQAQKIRGAGRDHVGRGLRPPDVGTKVGEGEGCPSRKRAIMVFPSRSTSSGVLTWAGRPAAELTGTATRVTPRRASASIS